ncbi:MAG: methylmalonyl-CoA mutase [Candidatus Geothermarchaeales archaeon]
MFDRSALERIRKEEGEWEGGVVKRWIEEKKAPEKEKYETISGIPVKRLYTPADVAELNYSRDLGFPGVYPFTRGIYPTMYRGRPWTIRMVSGYGSAEDANERFKFLLRHGETGLNLALDSPTIYGYDSDDPKVRGEVGQGGAPVSSLADLEVIFRDIPIDEITTSLITHFLGMPTFAMFVALVEKRGIPLAKVGGTTQNDPLWLFHVGNPPIPLKPSIKLSVDLLEWSVNNMPKWYAINVCGYHIREAGATAVQEAAFTLADATAYIDEALARGLSIDQFAPNISFFLNCHNNFFEEIAKFRAMRKVWARLLKEKYGARDPRSMLFKFHTQTAGCALTAQEAENNIVRTTIHALAAVLGGTQSLHTDSYDEALCLPTERAAKIALRTQQIIQLESGIPDTIDPLGGSYYVEWLTREVENKIWEYLDRVEDMGGVVEATEKQFFRREITESAYKYQLGVENAEIPVVGVNVFRGRKPKMKLLRVTREAEEKQIERLREVRERREKRRVEEALNQLSKAAKRRQNLTPFAIEAAKVYATNGEIYGVFREAYAEERAPTYF